MQTSDAVHLRETLQDRFGAALRERSLATAGAAVLALVEHGLGAERLALAAPAGSPPLEQFAGARHDLGEGRVLLLGPCDHANARALRAALPHLQPATLGLAASAGCGDRLGLATPGHVAAFQAVRRRPGARAVLPIFAQQSMREMARTGRSPDDVLCDATWGAFAAGWSDSLGADADHLKTPADVEACARAGFSFYTFDPGEHVDSAADTDRADTVQAKAQALPWDDLESTHADLGRRYAGKTVDLGRCRLALGPEAIWRAAAKYGRAIAHVARLYRRLEAQGVPFEVEVSVDETETPTSHLEHVYFASELRRLGVQWVSLAPRYVGRFEKGIDYLSAAGKRGDLAGLEADLAGHAAIARALGPYKLSLHSGSDKFSIYPLFVEATAGLAHLKTAGTSYLEALRVLAQAEPALFRAIGRLACERYPADRASYHVSAELSQWPDLARLADSRLPDLLDEDAPREILHVTFGSVLARHGAALKAALLKHRAAYSAALQRHFVRHLQPFTR